MARSVAEIAALAVLGCGGGSSRPPPPATTISPAAAPLVAAWTTAIGGRDRLAAFGVIHRTGKVVRNGVAGRFEKWTSVRGYRLDLVFDGFSEANAFDGTHGWIRDRAGVVRDLEGIELDAERAAMYWGNFAALFPDRQAGEVRTNPDGTLVIAPRDCRRPMTVSFDPATHLAHTLSQQQHGETATSTLDDYREVDGLKLPFHDHITVGNIAEADFVTTAIDHAPPDLTRPADRAPHLDAPIVLPYQAMRDGVPVIEVAIDGKPAELLVGTSTYSSLHVDRRAEFAPNAPGDREVPHLALTLGNLTLPEQVFDTRPFPNVVHYFGRGVTGALGNDVLSLFVVEIDPIAKTMTLFDRDTYRHAGAGIPITLELGTPWIEASVEVPGKPPATGRFELDTGCACAVMVRAPFTQEHGLLVGFDAARPNSEPTRGMVATITALRFADQRIDRPEAVFGLPHFGTLDDPESAGIIGMRVLGRYRLVLDYRHKRVWLDPPVSAASD